MKPIRAIMILVTLAMIAVLAVTGCGTKGNAAVDAAPSKSHIAEGTLEPFCREWTNSHSAYELLLSTNLFLLRTNGAWRVRVTTEGGELKPFWASDIAFDDSSDAMSTFRLNIDFAVQKGIFDAFSRM